MRALLVLEDGFILEGHSFTGSCESGGEVIFNTCTTGYQELLSDPSYSGQIVCLSSPLIGNYGVTEEDMESEKIHATALLVKECCKTPSSWRAKYSLPEFLQQHGVPGIEGIDTRALTRHIRIHGTMRGIISTFTKNPKELVAKAKELPLMEGQNLIIKVASNTPWILSEEKKIYTQCNEDGSFSWKQNKIPLLVYDFGIKWNIIRQLKEQNFDVVMVPPSFSIEQVKASGAKAIFLSNGPGDPRVLSHEVQLVRQLVELYPIAGICLGHQLLGLAVGGVTRKLIFGHHGSNHPVKNLITGHIEISSQNHGFCVDLDGISTIDVTHINLNDNTLEGFVHKTKPILTVQHHPEASPGPTDSQYFFRRFKDIVRLTFEC